MIIESSFEMLENRARDFENGTEADVDFPANGPTHIPGPREPSRRRGLRLPLLLAAPIVAVTAAAILYLAGGRHQSTDNAYLQSGLVSVGANVSGQVVSISVRENQPVRKGQVLFTLDPAPFQAAVAEAEADLAEARTQVGALRASYGQDQAELQAARDKLTYATGEAARQKALLAEGISSQAQYDQAVLAEQSAGQGIHASEQQNAGVLATLSGKVDAPADRQPTVERRQAVLDRARLDLAYSVVRASQDGVVTKVNQLQVGDYVAAARSMFTLAGEHIWVEANFKENQLDHMRIGQAAVVKVDAFPSLRLTGRLASFSPGTGNSFALLPPENATGNWVKVVQRLPVQIELDKVPAGVPLHAGLSVEVTVDTGYERHLFGVGATAKR
jgi:membrane fusion protein (multidrug efflux system)